MIKKVNRPKIPDQVKLKLWTKSGGRCQYRGCNLNLYKDSLKYADLNKSYIAHIYGYSPSSARYDSVLSPKLEKDFSNLMLMCDECHRRIDREEKDQHLAPLLLEMKAEHEKRIEILTSIKENVKTQVVFYTSKIGSLDPNINFEQTRSLLVDKSLYPSAEPIRLGHVNGTVEDNTQLYWQYEERSLVENFNQKVKDRLNNDSNNHYSLFALAPQPLLIRLGTLITDLYTVDVYQKHREPDTWAWQANPGFGGFLITEPKNKNGIPVLNLSLSATIDNKRIEKSLPDEELSIWTISHKTPSNNFLKSESILVQFRMALRSFFNKVKAEHGHHIALNVFPCMPNSAAIEFGRVWMPKADMSMNIFDERNGFKKAIEINRK